MSEQRIYHVTHIRNLPAILESGILRADLSEGWDERPEVDISSADTREARRSISVAGSGDATVAHFVPFFLSPQAGLWHSIRTATEDPRLSKDALAAEVADFVILVSTVKSVMEAASESESLPYVVADSDAAHFLTKFATTKDDAERSLRILRADQESEAPAIAQAELLVRDTFPLDSLTLIGVAHDKARVAVKKVLADQVAGAAGFVPKVAVYPPWFAAE